MASLSFGDGRKLIKFGNYNLDGVALGEGAFGKVELATHKKLKTKVALKFVDIRNIKDDYELKYLTREALLLHQMKHANIARIIQVVTTKEIYCLCVEFVPGETLLDDLSNARIYSEEKTKGIAGQLCGAIAYMHGKGIIHRDLKLENVMLSGDRVVVIDFGLSTLWRKGQLMKTHCGSAEYAAPELFRRDPHYGPSIDIWSFGIMLYGMLTGVLPFNADKSKDQVSLIPKINKGLGTEQHKDDMKHLTFFARRLIKKCLAYDPSTRITADKILNEPWIYLDNSFFSRISKDGIRTTKNVQAQTLQQLKHLLKLPSNINPIDILKLMDLRPFGNTAALYRLLELESECERKLPVLKERDTNLSPVSHFKDVTNTFNNENQSTMKKPTHPINRTSMILRSKFDLPQPLLDSLMGSKPEKRKTVQFCDGKPVNHPKKISDDDVLRKRPKRIRAPLRM